LDPRDGENIGVSCGSSKESRQLKEFQETSQLIHIPSAGLRKSHVHDVIITKEATNYRLQRFDKIAKRLFLVA
jgi:hypothetical protein